MSKVDFESSSIQYHLSFLQAIISRMATNSSSCKTWCITLVSAIIVIISTISNPLYIWLALVPLLLFLFLDAFYLGLERKFRDEYNDFVNRLHSGSLEAKDIYMIQIEKGFWKRLKATMMSIASPSIFPFYFLLIGVLVFLKYYILNPCV